MFCVWQANAKVRQSSGEQQRVGKASQADELANSRAETTQQKMEH
jgi:hypothetical protein